jgi:hypothetical protein
MADTAWLERIILSDGWCCPAMTDLVCVAVDESVVYVIICLENFIVPSRYSAAFERGLFQQLRLARPGVTVAKSCPAGF